MLMETAPIAFAKRGSTTVKYNLYAFFTTLKVNIFKFVCRTVSKSMVGRLVFELGYFRVIPFQAGVTQD